MYMYQMIAPVGVDISFRCHLSLITDSIVPVAYY